MAEIDPNDQNHSENLDSFPPLSSEQSIEAIGTRIGRYKLLSELGEGGFGIVYRARQERPFKRDVALKLILPGKDTRDVLARFEVERQALALLDHPNIAKVFDAGTTAVGRPYFVMEYVKGQSIDEYCDENKLSIKERLELFMEVCGAVQYAHHKGIIHRDLKPSNILVSKRNDKAAPVVIDFGIAKAMAGKLTARTVHTDDSHQPGTPAYMSPEQAGPANGDIDTRSDIYSLGVILYELLVGELPFESETFGKASNSSIRRMIRHEDPKTPSTRLSGLGDDARQVAKCRRTDVRTLIRSLKRELEWIPLKAMRKEPERRYQTTSEFARDIDNYLKGSPLIAGPESISYRTRKFVQRHVGSLAAVLAIVGCLVLGLIVSATLYVKAEQASKKSRDAALVAKSAETETRRQLARSQIEKGARLIGQGDCLGLLDLLDACVTTDHVTGLDKLESAAGRLWAIAHQLYSDRLVQVLPSAEVMAWSPNGKYLALANGTKAQLWRTASWEKHGSELELNATIDVLDFSKSGDLLLTHTQEGTCRVWNTSTGQQVSPMLRHGSANSYDGHNRVYSSASFSPSADLLATGSADGTVRLWSCPDGRPHGSRLNHEGEILTLDFSSDGKLLATGSSDQLLRIWDVESGQLHCPLLHLRGVVCKVAFAPDGKTLAAGTTHRVVYLCTRDGEIRKEFDCEAKQEGLSAIDLAFSPDSNLLATTGVDVTTRTAQIWDIETGHLHCDPLVQGALVRGISFSPDGRSVATSSADGAVQLWDVRRGVEYGYPFRHLERVQGIAFSPDGQCIATCARSCPTEVWRAPWRIPAKSEPSVFSPIPEGETAFPMANGVAGGTLRIVSSDEGDVQVFNESFQRVGHPLPHNGQIVTSSFSSDNRYLATASYEGEYTVIRTWHIDDGKLAGPARRLPWGPVNLVLSFSGAFLGISNSSSARGVDVLDVASGESLGTVACDEEITAYTFGLDNETLVTATRDGMIRFWDILSQAESAGPIRYKQPVTAMAYSPYGNLLAVIPASSGENQIHVYDVTASPFYACLPLPLQVLTGQQALSRFSIDGSILAINEENACRWHLPNAPERIDAIRRDTWSALGIWRSTSGTELALSRGEWQDLKQQNVDTASDDRMTMNEVKGLFSLEDSRFLTAPYFYRVTTESTYRDTLRNMITREEAEWQSRAKSRMKAEGRSVDPNKDQTQQVNGRRKTSPSAILMTWNGREESLFIIPELHISNPDGYVVIIPIKSEKTPHVEMTDAPDLAKLRASLSFDERLEQRLKRSGLDAHVLSVAVDVVADTELGILDVSTIRTKTAEDLKEWLGMNGVEPSEEGWSSLVNCVRDESFFIVARVRLENKFQFDIDRVHHHRILELIGSVTDAILRRTPQVKTAEELRMLSDTTEKVVLGCLCNLPYDEELGSDIGRDAYEEWCHMYAVPKAVYESIKPNVSNLCYNLLRLNANMPHALKITFSPKEPYLPILANMEGGVDPSTFVYIVSGVPLVHDGDDLYISRYKALTTQLISDLERTFGIREVQYLSEGKCPEESLAFGTELHFRAARQDERGVYPDPMELLFQAIDEKDMRDVREYVERMPNINAEYLGMTPLRFAVEDYIFAGETVGDGPYAIVEKDGVLVWEPLAPVDITLMPSLDNPFDHKTVMERIDTVKRVFSADDTTRVDSKLDDGIRIVRLLARHGARIGDITDMQDFLGSGFYDRELCELYVTISILQDKSWTDLHRSVAWGHLEAVEQCLRSGVDINARNSSGNTALHYAARGDSRIFEILLNTGANSEATNNKGKTPQDILEETVGRSPQVEDAWFMLASLEYAQGKNEDALDSVFRGLTHTPDSRDLLILKARIEGSRNPLLAMPILREVCRGYPEDTEAAIQLAQLYLKKGSTKEAVSLLTNHIRVLGYEGKDPDLQEMIEHVSLENLADIKKMIDQLR